jgi:hypothetical protein
MPKATGPKPACGLCGRSGKLVRTPCCNQWICDDADQYEMFSFKRNSCMRNHFMQTICGFHFNERHSKDGSVRWQDCPKCRTSFDTEMYVFYATNEYNFEKLENPPAFETTRCVTCGKVINLSQDGHTSSSKGIECLRCGTADLGVQPNAATVEAAPSGKSAKRKKKPSSSPKAAIVPEEYRVRCNEILAITDAFCDLHLNEEYRVLIRTMATMFCVAGSPAVQGQAKSWAAAIVYSIGWVNFLADPSQKPTLRTEDLARHLGVSVATIHAKAKVIREGFDLMQFDPRWTLPTKMDDNPLVWLHEINGIVVDFRRLSRDIQVMAFERGLIPYVPADRNASN